MRLANVQNKNAKIRNHLIFISISLSVTAVLYFLDIPIWQAARDLVEPNYLSIPDWFSDWGLYPFYTTFAVMVMVGFIKKRPNLINMGLAYLKAQLIFSLVVVRLLKILVGRPRPGADAFVSGVFLFYLLSQSKYSNYRFLPLIYAFLIAASRVFVSAHYPSDVAAGMAIGIMGAWFFISRLPDRHH
jgi:undecaprenyl-diphosphatase